MATTAASHVNASTLEVNFDKDVTKLYAAITSCNWDEAIATAKSNPEEARTWVVRHYDDEEDSNNSLENEEPEIMWRFLPIHSACARQPPAAVIAALLQAYPDGAKCIDDQGMYPLHYACGNQASREVIRSLLMSFPEAARMKDPRGMLPIHYLACWGPSSVSVIDMVLVAHRDVAGAKDSEGNTPLDLAIEGEYPEQKAVVAALKRWLENGANKVPSTPKSEPGTPLARDSPAVSTGERAPPQKTSSRRSLNGASQEPVESTPVKKTDNEVVTNIESIENDIGYSRRSGGDDRSYRSFRRSTNSYRRSGGDDRSYNGGSSDVGYRRSPTRTNDASSSPRKYSSGTGSQRLYRSLDRASRDEKKEEALIAPGPTEKIICPRTPLPPQQIDCSTMTTEHMSSPRTVGLLHDEIDQLKEEAKEAEESWEARFHDQSADFRERMEAMEAKIKELEMEQNQNNRQIAELQADVQEKDAELKSTKEQLEDKSNAFEKSEEERDGLRQTLADLTEQHDKFKKRSEVMQERLGSLNTSLNGMMEQQRSVLEATTTREKQYAEIAERRRNQLQELLKLDETKEEKEDEDDIKNCLVKQSKELEAITAVIAAVREG